MRGGVSIGWGSRGIDPHEGGEAGAAEAATMPAARASCVGRGVGRDVHAVGGARG